MEDWPKYPLKDPFFPHFKSKTAGEGSLIQGWYSQTPGLLFHACRPCIGKPLEITAAANDSSVREILSRTRYFVNSPWVRTENNCLDNIYFSGTLGYICLRCQTNFCLSVVHEEFNCLDKYYILVKK